MKIDLDELERRTRARLAISADIDRNSDDETLALIVRIRKLEAAAGKLLKAGMSGQVNCVEVCIVSADVWNELGAVLSEDLVIP